MKQKYNYSAAKFDHQMLRYEGGEIALRYNLIYRVPKEGVAHFESKAQVSIIFNYVLSKPVGLRCLLCDFLLEAAAATMRSPQVVEPDLHKTQLHRWNGTHSDVRLRVQDSDLVTIH
jgi:hypothetical protein